MKKKMILMSFLLLTTFLANNANRKQYAKKQWNNISNNLNKLGEILNRTQELMVRPEGEGEGREEIIATIVADLTAVWTQINTPYNLETITYQMAELLEGGLFIRHLRNLTTYTYALISLLANPERGIIITTFNFRRALNIQRTIENLQRTIDYFTRYIEAQRNPGFIGTIRQEIIAPEEIIDNIIAEYEARHAGLGPEPGMNEEAIDTLARRLDPRVRTVDPEDTANERNGVLLRLLQALLQMNIGQSGGIK